MLEQLERAGVNPADYYVQEYGGYAAILSGSTAPEVKAYLKSLSQRRKTGTVKESYPVYSRMMATRQLHTQIGHPHRWGVFWADPAATHRLPFDARNQKQTLLCHVGITEADIENFLKKNIPLQILLSPAEIVHRQRFPAQWKTIYDHVHRHTSEQTMTAPEIWFLRQHLRGETIFQEEATAQLQRQLEERFGINPLFLGDGGSIQTPLNTITYRETLTPNFYLRDILPHSALLFID